MAEAEKFKPTSPVTTSGEKKKLGEKKLVEDATEEAKRDGRPVEEVVKEKLDLTTARKYVLDFETSPGAPFFRPEYYGSQVRLVINRSHRFYSDIYDAPAAPTRLKAALELFLFVLGSSELGAVGDREKFYERERGEWSQQINTVLGLLEDRDPVDESAEADAITSEETSEVAG